MAVPKASIFVLAIFAALRELFEQSCRRGGCMSGEQNRDMTPASLATSGARSARRAQPVHSDAELIPALLRGDEAAFAELVQRYHAALLGVARLHVADAGLAEEVVQETWVGVLRGIGRFEGRASLKTWIFHILLNQARRRGAREHRVIPFSALVSAETDSPDPAVDPDRFRPPDAAAWPGHWSTPPQAWQSLPEDFVLHGETQVYLRAAIDHLPPAQRTVMALRDLEGWSAEEVCNILAISDSNQRVLLHRARSKVRGTLERYFLERGEEG